MHKTHYASLTKIEPEANVKITSLGIEFDQKTTFEEWKAVGPQIGRALRSMEFVIGDWLVFGERKFSACKQVPIEKYRLAIKETGLDMAVLRDYAYVSRHVRMQVRTDRLSWHHHRMVARLTDDSQKKHWLDVAASADTHVTCRRLRVSINCGRLVTVDEMEPKQGDRAIQNHIVPINRLVQWWHENGGRDWLRTRTPEQLAAMLRDFDPVISIVKAIKSESDLHPYK